MVIGRGASAFC